MRKPGAILTILSGLLPIYSPSYDVSSLNTWDALHFGRFNFLDHLPDAPCACLFGKILFGLPFGPEWMMEFFMAIKKILNRISSGI